MSNAYLFVHVISVQKLKNQDQLWTIINMTTLGTSSLPLEIKFLPCQFTLKDLLSRCPFCLSSAGNGAIRNFSQVLIINPSARWLPSSGGTFCNASWKDVKPKLLAGSNKWNEDKACGSYPLSLWSPGSWPRSYSFDWIAPLDGDTSVANPLGVYSL